MSHSHLVLIHRAFWFISVAFMVSSRSLEAQNASPVSNESSTARWQDMALAVGQHLRDGNVEQAFRSLEVAADASVPMALAERDVFSSTCAGLHRALSQMSSEAQFDLLMKWSIPADSPARVRVVTALVPTIAPPMEFARALGERPRNNSFAVSSIGEIQGLFSTGWTLVVAARESGRLKRLMADLGPLVDKQIPNAELLMDLAQIADGRGDASKVAERLSQRVVQLKAMVLQTGAGPKTIDPSHIVLASAALQIPALRPLAEEMLDALIATTYGQPAANVRSVLRRAHATAVVLNQENRGESSVASLLAPKLKYWVPVSEKLTVAKSPTMTEAIWLTQEDQILHLSGSDTDALLLRYPLVGEFQFRCETQIAGRIATDGGLIYGGLGFQTFGGTNEIRVMDPGGAVVGKRYCPFMVQSSTPAFQRWSMAISPNSATVAVNLHPIWTDKTGFRASPWLGLRSSDESRPLFRNLMLTGKPVIPRSVRLTDGNELRGWQLQVHGEHADADVSASSEWRIAEGVLNATKATSQASSTNLEQVLSYQRPLLSGEAISYEFFFEPGVREVSPALGRMAFLIQPEGIRIHWVTDGVHDWTGLAIDNSVTEPLHRRGPRPLPLKSKDWNRLTLARTDSAVVLTLNDVVVYQRPDDGVGDHKFGFYRQRRTTDAQVRNVVLTGDWPETVPQEFLDHPTATIGEPMSIADHHALNRLFQEEFLASNVFAIRRRALMMPVADRFDFLSKWVLPGPDHPGFRMAGDFTQSQPAPPAFEPGVTHPEQGGQIVSPVFDWLDAAKELGRLAECRRLVETARTTGDEFQQRARVALLMLLDLEQGDLTAAATHWETFYALLKAQTPVGTDDQWPETLVVDRGARGFARNSFVSELVSYIHANRTQQWRPVNNYCWHAQIMSLFGRMQFLKSGETEAAFNSPMDSDEWLPVAAARSNTRGQGFPAHHWRQTTGKVVKDACHDADFLFYRLPLKGNFEVACDLIDQTQILIAGKFLGPRWDRKYLDLGTFRGSAPIQPIEPPLVAFRPWANYRVAIRDGMQTISINGRQVQTEKLPVNSDPWIAIRNLGRVQGGVQDFRIIGQPEVLDAVPLSDSQDLTGWISYHEENVVQATSGWSHIEDPESSGWIVGRPNAGLTGAFAESLLSYQRPLVEDGSIEYEFFYVRGQVETHPALDRLALVLDPSGVREHWITDGRYDRTELPPDNLADAPKCRRGPTELPLKSDQWNRLKVILRGSNVRLELNETLVYERELEPTNQRNFGLFHYLDTEVRVRNAVMRGDWRKTVPTIANQKLAGEMMDSLELDVTRLQSVFRHDFQKNGLPEKYFKVPVPANGASISLSPDGLRMTQPSSGPWRGTPIWLRFSLSGDFDIEAHITGLTTQSDKASGAMLTAMLDEERKPEFRISRFGTSAGLQDIHTSRTWLQADGNRSYVGESKPFEAMSGRLRLARRGQKIFYLFAENDSDMFRLFGTETSPDADTVREGVFFYSVCAGIGEIEFVWKEVILRAERMKWYPDTSKASETVVSVMRADGTDFQTIATPATAGFTHVGSVEWSADGRKIAMDMSDGTTTTSHIIVMNADGSELQDLGLGCMPSFSGDGSRLAFSDTSNGIMTMKSDGTDRQVIDQSGWGTQWSPDGKWIVYGKAGNLTLLNVQTRESRQLLVGDDAVRYGYIYWNLGWSHDSRSVAFKARRRDNRGVDELAVVDLIPKDGFKVLHQNATALHPDYTFSADNQQVIVCTSNPAVQGPQMYRISRKPPFEPQLLPVQPLDQMVTSCAWSHDGKTIVMTTQKIPQPVEWITEAEAAP